MNLEPLPVNEIGVEIELLEEQLSKLKIPPGLLSLALVCLSLIVAWIIVAGFDLVVLILAAMSAVLLYVLMFAYQERRIARIGQRSVLVALIAYKKAIRELSLDPGNPELESLAMYAGRRYLRECRNEARTPNLDEARIRSDIAAARRIHSFPPDQGSQSNRGGRQSTQK